MKREGPERAAQYDWRKLAPRYLGVIQAALSSQGTGNE
jgi:hypothetical protein